MYFYAPKLFRALTMAHADGSITKLLQKLARADVLVVDDWGIAKITEQQYRDFLELLDDRYGSRATLMTSQFDINDWHETIPDPTVADAILDRVAHNAHKIDLKGNKSMRGQENTRS